MDLRAAKSLILWAITDIAKVLTIVTYQLANSAFFSVILTKISVDFYIYTY